MNYINKQSNWFASLKHGSITNPEESQEIQLELVKLLYRQALPALGTSIIVASVLGGILWQVADHNRLLVWFSVLMLITTLRALLVTAFRRADITVKNVEWWGSLYTAGALFAGFSWGSVAILWNPEWQVAYQVLLVLTLAGMSAAAISSDTSRLFTFAAFMFPLLLPLAGILLLHKEGAYTALGFLILLYSSMLFLITRNYHNTIKESLGYQYKNLALLDELNKQVVQLENEVAIRKEAQSDLVSLNTKLVHHATELKKTDAEISKYQHQLEMMVQERTEELEKTNEQLRQQIDERHQVEERNRLLLESTLDGIYAVDHNGICTVSNPAAAHMLGYDNPAELIGKNAHSLFHHTRLDGSDYPEQECVLSHGYAKTVTVNNEIFWRADGTSFPVECRASPIYQHKEAVGSVVSFTDVSQRLETESQLRHAQKLESVGQLAAGIAHEINTPTQFVNDNTRFLQEAFEDYDRLLKHYQQLFQAAENGTINKEQIDKVKEVTEEIDLDYLSEEIPQAVRQSQEGLKRISKIVRAMKEFSHPGMDEKTPTDINHAIETTIDVSRNEWKYHAEMETDFASALPQVPCLPSEINQVFLNLIVNASHAIADVVGNSSEMGVIRITTRQVDDWVEITVSDTGCGIAEEIQERIFDPFFTTKEVGKGTGQGLAIVYSAVVDKHGGTIALDSKLGEGATFIIRLPIKIDQDRQELES